MHRGADEDAGGVGRPMNPVRKVDGLAPQVVDPRTLAEQPTRHRPAVDAGADCEFGAVLRVGPLDDLGELTGERDGPAGVVDARHHQSAGREKPVVQVSDPFDAVSLGGLVDAFDQRVQQSHRIVGRRRPGEIVEPDDFGVDDGHVAVVPTDVLLTVAVPGPTAPASGWRAGRRSPCVVRR